MVGPFVSPRSRARLLLVPAVLLLGADAPEETEAPRLDLIAPVADETHSFWAAPVFADRALDVKFVAVRLDKAVRFLTGEESNVITADSPVVSMDLRNVHTGQALDFLLESQNLGARFEGHTVFLTPSERRTYQLPLVVQQSGTIWDEVEAGITALRSDDGVVALNKGAGILSVEDYPAHLDRLENHLHQVLQSLLRQVEIETKIMEVTFKDQQGAGIDWALFSGILDPAWGVTGGAIGGLVGMQSVTDHRELFQVGVLKPGKFQAFVDAFDEEISLNLVSRPRITLMSNQSAQFEVKERIPYLTKTVSVSQGQTVTEFQLAFDEAGIKLLVSASIDDGGMVTLDVNPVISAVTGFTASLPDLGPQPIIDSRETHSTVRLPEGHSLVMSGLMQDRENVTTVGVPLLSKVPLLGRLFRSEQVRTDKTEIVVVLTPTLRREPAVRTLVALDRIEPVRVDLTLGNVPAELAAARTERAWERLVAGDRVGSLALAEAAHRVKPAAWWTLNNLGLARRELGYLAQAEYTLRRAVRSVDPPPPAALVNLGTLLVHRNQPAQAVRYLEAAVGAADPGPLRDEAVLAWSLALELSGRDAEALEALERVGGTRGRHRDRTIPRVNRMVDSREPRFR